MTYADLIAEVRAQIDVSDDQAWAYLLDRARVLNAETSWLLFEVAMLGVTDQSEYSLPADVVKTEAVIIGGLPYRRSTLSAMDEARAWGSSRRIYADAVDPVLTGRMISIYPVVSDGTDITIRYLADIADDRTGTPPFPTDFHQALADGAIAYGLARMDERFDSAGYFDARFVDSIARLRRRRNSRVGRGGVPIRVRS
jgi:hypothetical protein